jgi:hypothetical protein
MRIRTGFCLLICCCAGLTACTAAAPKALFRIVSPSKSST